MSVDYEEGRRLLTCHAMYRVEASERDLAEWFLDNAEALLNPDPWRGIEEAVCDGRMALVYRPLASTSGDQPIAVKRLIGGNNYCWPSTVPEGCEPCNPTDGSCHVTHYREVKGPGQ